MGGAPAVALPPSPTSQSMPFPVSLYRSAFFRVEPDNPPISLIGGTTRSSSRVFFFSQPTRASNGFGQGNQPLPPSFEEYRV